MMNWLEQAKNAWFVHTLCGLVLQALVSIPLYFFHVAMSLWFGAMAVNAWFYSRKKTELEFELKEAAGGTTLGPYWMKGFFPWQWDNYLRVLEWIIPVIVTSGVAAFGQIFLGIK